jgi:Flp pilus assembly pilin Flp
MRNSKSFIARFWRAKDGAAAVEYALMLAIVCCGIAVGASMLAGSINETVTQLAACLEQPISCLAPS